MYRLIRLWQNGSSRIRIADTTVWLLWLVYILVFSVLSVRQHESIRTGLDLALHDNYVWNLAAGHFLRNTIIEGSTIWNFYFAPLLAALTPIYALWNGARTILVLQTIALASGVFPVYWYARSKLGAGLALIFVVSYFLYPALEFVNLLNFHVIALSVPIFSFALFFLLRKNQAPFLVCVGLLLLVKEEALFAVLGMGLYVLLVQRQRLVGAAILIGASAWFVVLFNFIFPALFGRSYFVARTGMFGYLGNNLSEILGTVFNRPDQVGVVLFTSNNLEYFLQLVAPLAFLPVLSIEIMLVALPILGMTFLTKTAGIGSQYPSLMIPCIYFGAIAGMASLSTYLQSRWKSWLPYTPKMLLGGLLAGASLLGFALDAPGPMGGRFDPSRYLGLGSRTSTYLQILGQVPPQAVAVVQEEMLPHFSAREYIYSFPAIPDYRQAEYLVGNRNSHFFDMHQGTWKAWLSTGYFETVLDRDDFFLARRIKPATQLDVRFTNGINLLGYSLAPTLPWQGGQLIAPIVEWRTTKPLTERFTFTAQVVDAQGHVWAKSTGEPHNGATPTTSWQVGRAIGDQYQLTLPPTMPTGDYQLVFEIHAPSGAYIEGFDANGVSLGTGIVLPPIRIEKNRSSVTASELQMGERLYVDMREMRLLGFELARRDYQIGDIVQLGLYWRARTQPQGDYLVSVQMRDSTGRVAFETLGRPAQNTYPTPNWSAGEVLLDWHDWQIPLTIQAGTYTLRIALIDSSDHKVLGQADLAALTLGQ